VPIPKTLFISATPPGTAGTGEAFLREICLAFPKNTISFLVLESLNYAIPGDSNDIKEMHFKRVKLPVELLDPLTKVPGFRDISIKLQRKKYWREVDSVKQIAIEYAKQQGCTQILAVFGSPTVTVVANEVAKALNAQLICLVWDPHETTMQLLHFDEDTKKTVMKHFEDCIKRSKTLAVASEGMSEEYKKRYRVESIPLVRPIREDQIRRNRSRSFLKQDKRIVIGFSGSLYATNEFASLWEALSSVDWIIQGKRVTFRILSNYFFFPHEFEQKYSSIHLMGFRDQKSVIAELADCHVAYLPYWFDENRALSVRTCFPDKLGTYLTSGLPIFFHGPKQSTPADFFAGYPVGRTCHSLDKNAILETLNQLISDETCRDAAWEARNRALKEQFSLATFRSKIARLLDVPAEELNSSTA